MYAHDAAISKATEALSNHFAKTKVSAAIGFRNGPDTSDVHSTQIWSHVLVYSPMKDKWEGKFSLLYIKGETCTFLLSSVPTKFRNTVSKIYIDGKNTDTESETSTKTPTSNGPELSSAPQSHTILSFMVINLEEQEDVESFMSWKRDTDDERFFASRKKDMNGLMNHGFFTLVHKSEARVNRIYGGRFVYDVKK